MEERSFEELPVVGEVSRIREKHRGMGTGKLHGLLEPFMLAHRIKMGRDALFDLLSDHNLLVRKRRKRVRTTDSYHRMRKYPNLIKGFVPKAVNRLWVSDITYWKIKSGFVYISFITDVFSHKIVGYHVAPTLEAIGSKKALEAAPGEAKGSLDGLIHHSDRGMQYCSNDYVGLLREHGILISMTESGDPLENAVAERVNGIIKGEYLDFHEVDDISVAKRLLPEVIRLYNEERPHMSIGNVAPGYIHDTNQKRERLWKNHYPKNRDIVNR